jgi:hypothetical protein
MASRCAWLGACASAGVAAATIAAMESSGASFAARFNVSFIGQSFSSQEAAASGRSKKFRSKKFQRRTSFSLSGSTASGLLLFSWGSAARFFLNRKFFEKTN